MRLTTLVAMLPMLLGMSSVNELMDSAIWVEAATNKEVVSVCKEQAPATEAELASAHEAWKAAFKDRIAAGKSAADSNSDMKPYFQQVVDNAVVKLRQADAAGSAAFCTDAARNMRMSVEDLGLIRRPSSGRSASPTDRAIELRLLSPTAAVRAEAVDEVRANPGRYAASVLMTMADELFLRGDKDEAAFWLRAADLRKRVDLGRLESEGRPTLALNLGVLSKIHEYAISDLAAYRAATDKALAWDAATPRASDPSWMFALGEKPRWQANVNVAIAAKRARAAFAFDADWFISARKTGKPLNSNRYRVEDGKVSFDFNTMWVEKLVLPDADAQTFVEVGTGYGRDARRAYWRNIPFDGADVTKLRQISWVAATDGKSAWFGAVRCAECDAATLRVLRPGEDKAGDYVDRAAYYSVNPKREGPVVTRIAVPDASAVVAVGEAYVKDKTTVWYEGRAIEGADAASFEMQVCGKSQMYARDKSRFYFYGKPQSDACKAN
jgi:hypothetical protein